MPSSQLSKSSVEFLAIENKKLRIKRLYDFWRRCIWEYFHTLHFIQQMYFLVYSNSSVRGRAQSMKSKSTQICFFSNIAKYYKIFGIWISSQWFTWTEIKIELRSPFELKKSMIMAGIPTNWNIPTPVIFQLIKMQN